MRALRSILLLTVAAMGLAAQPGLIRLDLTARDDHGRFVRTLTADDVAVFDNGKPQQIALFQPWGIARSAKEPALAPHEFSNRIAELPHLTVVVLNLLDNTVQRLQVAETLRAIEQNERQDEIYLYTISSEGGALLPIHALPRSAEEWTAEPRPWIQGTNPQMPAFLPRRGPESLSARVVANCSALESLAHDMEAMPGRKSVVWIGELPLLTRRRDIIESSGGQSLADRISGLLGQLAIADVAVSVVRATKAQAAISVVNGMPPIVESMPGMTAATGGRVYGADIGKVIDGAIEDTDGGYRLFYAPEGVTNAVYHNVRLKSDFRKVTLTAEQGYDSSLRDEPRTGREAMQALAANWFDAQEIGMRAVVTSAGSGKLHLDLQLDPADLLFEKGRARISVQVLDYRADGRPLAVAEAKIADLRSGALKLPMEVTFDGSVSRVRVLVYQEPTQLAGSLTIAIAEAAK